MRSASYLSRGGMVLVTLQSEEDHNVRFVMPDNFAEFFTETVISEIINSVRRYKLIHRKYEEMSHIHIIIE
jgi:hypothetical protein